MKIDDAEKLLPDEAAWRTFDNWCDAKPAAQLIIVVVGKQSVGKSSAARRIVNRLLRRSNVVSFIIVFVFVEIFLLFSYFDEQCF
jgi:polynucleotide 5'-kinase involved in rRNA processing